MKMNSRPDELDELDCPEMMAASPAQTLAGGQNDGSLNKLPQIIVGALGCSQNQGTSVNVCRLPAFTALGISTAFYC